MIQDNFAEKAGKFVYGKIHQWLNFTQESERKALLANLRHGAGKRPGEIPQLWGAYLQDLPEELIGYGLKPSYAEWAIYTALTMFALHQQGKDPLQSPMNQKDVTLGQALGLLARKDANSETTGRDRVLHRFYPMSTAEDMDKLTYYLRGLIQLLRSESIPLDYPKLTEDLYWYQIETVRPNIRLKWGEDFYRTLNSSKEKETKEQKNEE